MGLEPLGEGDHLVRRRHLEVERLRQFGGESRHVDVADMAAILAQMRRDPVRAGCDGKMRGADRVGQGAAARITDGRDVIDVHAQAQSARHCCSPQDPNRA